MTTETALSLLDDLEFDAPAINADDFGESEYTASGGIAVPRVKIDVLGIDIIEGGEVVSHAPMGATLDVIVVDASAIGRSYYAAQYDKESKGAPDCRSYDGIKPDAIVENPIHTDCKTCPLAQKGSSTSMPKGTACTPRQNLAVMIVAKDQQGVYHAVSDNLYRLSLASKGIFATEELPDNFIGYKPLVLGLSKRRSQRFPTGLQPFQTICQVKQNPLSAQAQTIFLAHSYSPMHLLDKVKEYRADKEHMNAMLGKYDSMATVEYEALAEPKELEAATQAAPTRNTASAPKLPYKSQNFVDEIATYWKQIAETKVTPTLTVRKVIKVEPKVLLPCETEWEEVAETDLIAYDQMLEEANKPPQETQVRTRVKKETTVDTAAEEKGKVVNSQRDTALTNDLDALLGDDDDDND